VTPETLEEIEESVHSPHLEASSEHNDVDSARHEVMQALQSSTPTVEALTALNASPLGAELHLSEQPTPAIHSDQVEIDRDGNLMPKSTPTTPAVPSLDEALDESTPLDMPLPPLAPEPSNSVLAPQSSTASTSASPPPVPPPFMPPPMNPGQ
jgi:hypothetical protein